MFYRSRYLKSIINRYHIERLFLSFLWVYINECIDVNRLTTAKKNSFKLLWVVMVGYPSFTRIAKIGPIFVVRPKKIGKFLSFCPILCNRILFWLFIETGGYISFHEIFWNNNKLLLNHRPIYICQYSTLSNNNNVINIFLGGQTYCEVTAGEDENNPNWHRYKAHFTFLSTTVSCAPQPFAVHLWANYICPDPSSDLTYQPNTQNIPQLHKPITWAISITPAFLGNLHILTKRS